MSAEDSDLSIAVLVLVGNLDVASSKLLTGVLQAEVLEVGHCGGASGLGQPVHVEKWDVQRCEVVDTLLLERCCSVEEELALVEADCLFDALEDQEVGDAVHVGGLLAGLLLLDLVKTMTFGPSRNGLSDCWLG